MVVDWLLVQASSVPNHYLRLSLNPYLRHSNNTAQGSARREPWACFRLKNSKPIILMVGVVLKS